MTDNEARGIAGDRRRNPFPSMNETEYALFLMTIRDEVRAGVTAVMNVYHADNCVGHFQRTDRLEADCENMDKRIMAVENVTAPLKRITWLVIGAMVVGLVGLLLTVANMPAIGG